MFEFAGFGNYVDAFVATAFIASFGALLSSAEYLAIKREFRADGVYSWKILSSRPGYVNNMTWLNKIDFLFGYRGFVSLNLLRILCCSGVLASILMKSPIWAPLLWFLAASATILSYRNIVGGDGSDQMSLLVFTSLAISASSRDPFVQKAGMIFLASQSVLSYVAAGMAKAVSIKWRNGVALPQIMNTRTYGMEIAARQMAAQPRWVNLLFCWAVIVIEIGFLVVPVLPMPWVLVFLAWGVLFHVGNAVAMGLNNFFWSFTATYPAIIYLNHLIRD